MFLFAVKRHCPGCQSRDVRRSVRWGLYETCILPIILMRPYRCHRCDSRFFGFIFAGREKRIPQNEDKRGTPENPSDGRLVKA